jgi:hypothetical protein
MRCRIVARGHPRDFGLLIGRTRMAPAGGGARLQRPWRRCHSRLTAALPVPRIGLPPCNLLNHMANKQSVIYEVAMSEPLRFGRQAE